MTRPLAAAVVSATAGPFPVMMRADSYAASSQLSLPRAWSPITPAEGNVPSTAQPMTGEAVGEPLRLGVAARPDVVKPNVEEAERLVRRRLPDQRP